MSPQQENNKIKQQAAVWWKQRRARIGMIAAAVVLLSATTLYALAWTPDLKLKNPSPQKLTPGDCSSFVFVPHLQRNVNMVSGTDAGKKFAATGAPAKFLDLMSGPAIKKLKKKLGGRLTPSRLKDLLGDQFSMATYIDADKKKRSRLIVTKLDMAEKVMINMGRRRLGRPFMAHGFYVQEVRGGDESMFITMGGDYLFLSDDRDVMERALALGAAAKTDSVAEHALYKRTGGALDRKSVVFEWFSPESNFRSPLTNFKINHGAAVFDAKKGLSLRVTTVAQSRDEHKPRVASDPSALLPATVSLVMDMPRFGRVWRDMLLGKAFDPEKAETFMQQLYELGVEDLGAHFHDSAVLAMDGVFRSEDRTPVPNFIFVFKISQKSKVQDTVHKILRTSIKEDFNAVSAKYNGYDYVSFKQDYESAVVAPTYAIIGDYLVFTLTETAMKAVLDAAAEKTPSFASTQLYKKYYGIDAGRRDMLFLMDCPRLAGHIADYLTWFGDISSPALSQTLAEVVIPATTLLENADAAEGAFRYNGDLLQGEIVFHRKSRE